MNVSFNEIETLSKRAARGAGLSWGLAEEAGKATRYLSQYDIAGIDILSDILKQYDEGKIANQQVFECDNIWQARADHFCPLVAGAILCDRANMMTTGQKIEFLSVRQPLILIPFISMAAKISHNTFELSWDKTTLIIGVKGWEITYGQIDLTIKTVSKVSCQVLEQKVTSPMEMGTRSHINQKTWKCLEEYASRIFAPNTDISRNSGAGSQTNQL